MESIKDLAVITENTSNKMLSTLHYSEFKIADIVIWPAIIGLFQMNG